MKSIKLASAVALVVGLAAAGSAVADTGGGYITFKGSVNASTCTISGVGGVAGTGANFTVALDPVDVAVLNTAGTANPKSFGVQVGSSSDPNCVIQNGATMSFEKTGYVDILTGALSNGDQNGAKDTYVQLLDSTGKALNLALGDTVAVSAVAGNGPVLVPLQAQYYTRTNQATAGAVATGVQYTVNYN